MQIMTTTIEAGIVILSPCFPLFGPENPNHSKHSMDCVTGNAYTQAYPDSRARILPPRHVELGTRRSPPPLSLSLLPLLSSLSDCDRPRKWQTMPVSGAPGAIDCTLLENCLSRQSAEPVEVQRGGGSVHAKSLPFTLHDKARTSITVHGHIHF